MNKKCIFYKIVNENIDSNRRTVNLIYNSQILNENQKLKHKLLAEHDGCIEVSELPKLECGENQGSILYYNIETNELEYEYYDLPKTEEQLLKERIQSLELALANIMGIEGELGNA